MTEPDFIVPFIRIGDEVLVRDGQWTFHGNVREIYGSAEKIRYKVIFIPPREFPYQPVGGYLLSRVYLAKQVTRSEP